MLEDSDPKGEELVLSKYAYAQIKELVHRHYWNI